MIVSSYDLHTRSNGHSICCTVSARASTYLDETWDLGLARYPIDGFIVSWQSSRRIRLGCVPQPFLFYKFLFCNFFFENKNLCSTTSFLSYLFICVMAKMPLHGWGKMQEEICTEPSNVSLFFCFLFFFVIGCFVCPVRESKKKFKYYFSLTFFLVRECEIRCLFFKKISGTGQSIPFHFMK